MFHMSIFKKTRKKAENKKGLQRRVGGVPVFLDGDVGINEK